VRPSTAMGRSQMGASRMNQSRIGGKVSTGKNMPASKPSYQ